PIADSGSCSGYRQAVCAEKRLGKPCEHHKVGVERDSFKPANAKRRESIVMLQAPELALDGSAATVEVLPALRVAGDAREQSATQGQRQRGLILLSPAQRNDRLAPSCLALVIDANGVIALVHSDRFGLEAASVERVEKRGDELGLVVPRRLNLPRERQAGLDADRELELVAVEATALACR